MKEEGFFLMIGLQVLVLLSLELFFLLPTRELEGSEMMSLLNL